MKAKLHDMAAAVVQHRKERGEKELYLVSTQCVGGKESPSEPYSKLKYGYISLNLEQTNNIKPKAIWRRIAFHSKATKHKCLVAVVTRL